MAMDWQRMVEWFQEICESYETDEFNEVNFEEQKETSRKKEFSEFYFGTPTEWGWHITDKP